MCVGGEIATNTRGLSLFSICEPCSPRPHISPLCCERATGVLFRRPHNAYLTPCALARFYISFLVFVFASVFVFQSYSCAHTMHISHLVLLRVLSFFFCICICICICISVLFMCPNHAYILYLVLRSFGFKFKFSSFCRHFEGYE